ncbi:T9SS type A sorting domain-containing protein [Seonamhaeicola algicola]|uniref:T9SS type A sorting domain-containing protein n=1 Tax=Seonamhaeicola algicola TaxID=1719036 RepID=A0A5C7ALK8_9FLAO|nr:T9SS type A sorting domain-containing protein [Seonamhaeicola algicola]TXE09626.1 T9SS type A sorting domain-containing protein [Seonamhaeicola algicola]
MKKFVSKTMVICCLLLFETLFSQNQPSFSAGQDPKPGGKKWEKIENLSDEFDNGFVTTKWAKNIPTWEGRKPARFETANVSVSGGELKLVAKTKDNPYDGWTHEGAAVRSVNKAPFGYYEVSMKANKTFMSSTFWLINEVPSNPTACERRTTELDVVECVGINTNGGNGFTNEMSSNSHSRPPWCPNPPGGKVINCPWPAGCNYQTGTQGNNAPLGGFNWAGFHTYGVWYKNKDEATFFLDGQNVGTINLPSDFNLDMYLRFVVETYDWIAPSPGADGMNSSLSDRTTRYDWVRSWKLVDCTGNDCGTPSTATVNCNSLPDDLTTSTAINVSIGYTADQQRDVVVELWNATTNSWLAEGKATVSAGTSTASVTMNIGTAPPAGSNYLLKASIRPVGANWQSNIDACTKTGVSLISGNTGGPPDVDCASLPNSLSTSTSINVPIVYTSNGQLDVVVELWNASTNSWLAQGSKTVGAGSGTAIVTINTGTAPSAGSNYLLKASIRPVGSSWQSNIDSCTKTGVSLINGSAGSPDVDCASLPSLLQSSTSIEVPISYTSNGQLDVVVELWNASTNSWLAGGTTTVSAGSDTEIVTINLGISPAAGSNYLLKASIRPVGSSWQSNIDACSKTGVTLTNTANKNIKAKSVVNSDEVLNDKVIIYPNPLHQNEEFNIILGNSEVNKNVKIYDLRGKIIYKTTTTEEKINIDSKTVFKTQGLYFIKVQDESGDLKTLKLVVN